MCGAFDVHKVACIQLGDSCFASLLLFFSCVYVSAYRQFEAFTFLLITRLGIILEILWFFVYNFI